MKKLIFLIALWVGSLSSFAQVSRTFSFDKGKFVKEVEQLLTDAKTDSGKVIAKEFVLLYSTQQFDILQDSLIILYSNAIASKKYNTTREFEDYYRALTFFKINNHKPENFTGFMNVISKLSTAKSRDLALFLDFSRNLFAENAIYFSPDNKWLLRDKEFLIVMDSVPKVVVSTTDIIGTARFDSTLISGTSGTVYPIAGRWEGNKGKVDWQRVALDPTKVYAELDKYKIILKNAEFEADSVIFYNKDFFQKPLKGKFFEKMTANSSAEKANYPKFESYAKELEIKNIFKNINIKGGFSMSGSKSLGYGDRYTNALVTIYYRDSLVFKASSKSFIILADRILSDNVESTLYIGAKDSIYHPAVSMRYLLKDKKLSLFRGNEGISRTPFYDSYHELNIAVEAIYWVIDQPILELATILSKVQKEASFESTNYYRENRFSKVQGISSKNPLVILKRLSERYSSRVIAISDYSKEFNLQPSAVISQLRTLVEEGFIFLDESKSIITVRDRTLNYVSNEAGKLDYDVIRLISLADSNRNATLNLQSKELKIIGAQRFFLSDSQSVYIQPKDGLVTVAKDRNMSFSGDLKAGSLEFIGNGFTFDYENFSINLDKVDSMMVTLVEKNKKGDDEAVDVKTALEKVSGTLYIDDKNNKSGLKNYPQYPGFESVSDSYVYYDKKEIRNGAYTRDKFYFKLVPFKVDSLNSSSATKGLSFPGTLVSGGIFPDIKQTLTYQPDSSLGFLTKTPITGFPAYNGKGKFTNNIRLSHKGLVGDGTLNYLSSTATSNDFVFMPDSMNANVKTFDIKKGVYLKAAYPAINISQGYIHWLPKADSMYLFSRKKAFEMYDAQSLHTGRMVYSPVNLSGNGSSRFNNATVSSKYFVFNENDFHADSSGIQISAIDTTKIALASTNIRSEIDFEKKQGTFKTNKVGDETRFILNQYETSLGEFVWDFLGKAINFSAKKGTPLSDSYFLSTRKSQDSLSFYATNAVYLLDKDNIDIRGVNQISVADAFIYPDRQFVQIEPNAVMKLLENAKITANTLTKFHEFYNAKVNVNGRKSYNASGTYDFKNKTGKVQQINFTDINVDSNFQTVGIGIVPDDQILVLTPQISFRGNVYMKAASKDMTYKGYAKIQQLSKLVESDFFDFSGAFNIDSNAIEIKNPKKRSGEKLFSGMHIANFEGNAYATFISKKVEPNDHDIIKVEGELIYNEVKKEFKIGDKDKVFSGAKKGKMLTFNEITEISTAEGLLDAGIDLGNGYKNEMAGAVTYDLKNNSILLDVVLTADFAFLEKTYSRIIENVKLNSFEAPMTRDDRKVFANAISELVPKKAADKISEDIMLYGGYKIPSELEHTIVFSDLQLTFDQQTRSFKSVGKTIGIASLGKEQINKRLKGYLSIVRTQGQNALKFYFETAANEWYYFDISNGYVEALSSDQPFNDVIMANKKETNKMGISSSKRKQAFVRDFE